MSWIGTFQTQPSSREERSRGLTQTEWEKGRERERETCIYIIIYICIYLIHLSKKYIYIYNYTYDLHVEANKGTPHPPRRQAEPYRSAQAWTVGWRAPAAGERGYISCVTKRQGVLDSFIHHVRIYNILCVFTRQNKHGSLGRADADADDGSLGTLKCQPIPHGSLHMRMVFFTILFNTAQAPLLISIWL